MTEDTMIKLAEEHHQKHSDEVVRISTNRADAKKLHDFPRKIVLRSVQHAGFSRDEYWRCGERSDLLKANTKAAQKKQKDPATV